MQAEGYLRAVPFPQLHACNEGRLVARFGAGLVSDPLPAQAHATPWRLQPAHPGAPVRPLSGKPARAGAARGAPTAPEIVPTSESPASAPSQRRGAAIAAMARDEGVLSPRAMPRRQAALLAVAQLGSRELAAISAARPQSADAAAALPLPPDRATSSALAPSSPLLHIAELDTGIRGRCTAGSPTAAQGRTGVAAADDESPAYLFAPLATSPRPAAVPLRQVATSNHYDAACASGEHSGAWSPPAAKRRYTDKRRERARAREHGAALSTSSQPCTPPADASVTDDDYVPRPRALHTSSATSRARARGAALAAPAAPEVAVETLGKRRLRDGSHPGAKYTGVSYKQSANHFEAQFYERESKTCNEGGRATSLGVFGFDPTDEVSMEQAAEQAARASDRATVMFYHLKGASAASIQGRLNFSIEDYMDPGEVKSRANCADFSSYIAVLRSAHSHRPITGYKGVHQRGPDGKYEARNSPFPSFGRYSGDTEAARAYDIGYLLFRGKNGKLNFSRANYLDPATDMFLETVDFPDAVANAVSLYLERGCAGTKGTLAARAAAQARMQGMLPPPQAATPAQRAFIEEARLYEKVVKYEDGPVRRGGTRPPAPAPQRQVIGNNGLPRPPDVPSASIEALQALRRDWHAKGPPAAGAGSDGAPGAMG